MPLTSCYHFSFAVCIDVRIINPTQSLQSYRSIKWELGSCVASSNYINRGTYGNYYRSTYSVTERCCTDELANDLSCMILHVNAKNEGWADGYMEIQGHHYCNDFIGYSSLRKVLIKGMPNLEFRFPAK